MKLWVKIKRNAKGSETVAHEHHRVVRVDADGRPWILDYGGQLVDASALRNYDGMTDEDPHAAHYPTIVAAVPEPRRVHLWFVAFDEEVGQEPRVDKLEVFAWGLGVDGRLHPICDQGDSNDAPHVVATVDWWSNMLRIGFFRDLEEPTDEQRERALSEARDRARRE